MVNGEPRDVWIVVGVLGKYRLGRILASVRRRQKLHFDGVLGEDTVELLSKEPLAVVTRHEDYDGFNVRR